MSLLMQGRFSLRNLRRASPHADLHAVLCGVLLSRGLAGVWEDIGAQMTEPTAEQIEREREGAHELACSIDACAIGGLDTYACVDIATALARVRIEAVEGAARAAIERAHDLGVLADKQESIAKAIRALRGRE